MTFQADFLPHRTYKGECQSMLSPLLCLLQLPL